LPPLRGGKGGGAFGRGARLVRSKTDIMEILLKYKNQKPAITRAIRISKPSKRVYVSVDQLKQIKKGS
jgi:ribosomal protein S8